MSSLLDGGGTFRGEVGGRLNAAVSKTVVPRKRYRGFESPLRLFAGIADLCRACRGTRSCPPKAPW